MQHLCQIYVLIFKLHCNIYILTKMRAIKIKIREIRIHVKCDDQTTVDEELKNIFDI